VSGEWSSRVKRESGKNDLKSSSSLPLHAQGRRRTMPFKTTLFRCSFFFLKKRKCNWEKQKMGYDMWYNHLNEYLLEKWFQNNKICPCIFIKKTTTGFVIVAVYVDDLNLVGTPGKLTKITTYLKDEFEMKDLGKNFFFFCFTY
jgi:hypothetical protein